MKSKILKALSAGVILSAGFLTASANAGLIDRGNGMIYDDVLNVTWLKDANYAQTIGHDSDGSMTWNAAKAWADNLVYGGFDDWRLTKTYDVGNDGCNFSFTGGTDCGYNVLTSFTDGNGDTFFSELAYMFYQNLNNVAYYDTSGNAGQAGWDTVNTSFTDASTGDTVSFDNLFRSVYWSGTEYASNTNGAWGFGTIYGNQGYGNKSNHGYAWAVRDGDVAVAAVNAEVPEPASIAIFALGVLGLTLRQRQRRWDNR